MTDMTPRIYRASTTETAKLIRQDLKATFPSIKFSVRSHTRGTDAIVVEWEDGPTTRQVEALVNGYQEGDFDGMTDCYNYHGGKMINGREYGVRWMQTQRNMSPAADTRFEALIRQWRGDLEGKQHYEISNLAWREFCRWDGTTMPLPETIHELPSAIECRGQS